MSKYEPLWRYIKENEKDEYKLTKVASKGYQVLSFDLPEHGERKDDTNYLCKVQNCVKDLKSIIVYAREEALEKIFQKNNFYKIKIKKIFI